MQDALQPGNLLVEGFHLCFRFYLVYLKEILAEYSCVLLNITPWHNTIALGFKKAG